MMQQKQVGINLGKVQGRVGQSIVQYPFGRQIGIPVDETGVLKGNSGNTGEG
jgi:hypothetical protein